jgi:hypothetical protein
MNKSIKIRRPAALILVSLGLFTSVFSACSSTPKVGTVKQCNCECTNSSYKAHTDAYERCSSDCKVWCSDMGVPGSAQTCFESDVCGTGGTGGSSGTGGSAGTGTAGKAGAGGSAGSGTCTVQTYPYCVVCTTDILHCSTEFDILACTQSAAKEVGDAEARSFGNDCSSHPCTAADDKCPGSSTGGTGGSAGGAGRSAGGAGTGGSTAGTGGSTAGTGGSSTAGDPG